MSRSLSKSVSPPGEPQSRVDIEGLASTQGSSNVDSEYNGHSRNPSPRRPTASRKGSSRLTTKARRSSASSTSSGTAYTPRTSSSNLLSLGLLPLNKWQCLRHLSLSDNGLTSITTSSLVPVAATLQSLDLSSNLFNEVPDSLASLTSLRALNLADCLIDSLRSLSKHPLPAITTLNLRGNKIMSLSGIERLLSLERIDLRDNKMTDPAEVSRLVEAPDFAEVYVLRNPFVKTHPSYRTTIFNAFRNSPGNTVDVIIDSAGPSYNEKRQLIDRAPERVAVPVVQIPTEDEPCTPALHNQRRDHFKTWDPATEHDIAASHSIDTPPILHAQRRQKATRRRIVDITQSETPRSEVRRDQSNDGVKGQASEYQAARMGPDGLTPVELPIRSFPVPSSAHSPLQDHPAVWQSAIGSATDIGVSDMMKRESESNTSCPATETNTYRKRIEALKADHGSSWLSAYAGDKVGAPPSRGSVDYQEKALEAASRMPHHDIQVGTLRSPS